MNSFNSTRAYLVCKGCRFIFIDYDA